MLFSLVYLNYHADTGVISWVAWISRRVTWLTPRPNARHLNAGGGSKSHSLATSTHLSGDTGSGLSRLDTKRQCAINALEMMSNGEFRTHVINVTISNANLVLWHFDRCGTIGSGPISIKNDFPKFINLILRLAYLSEPSFGFHSSFEYPSPSPALQGSQNSRNQDDPTHEEINPDSSFFGVRMTVDGRKLVFGEVLTRQYTLVGRGTLVVKCYFDEEVSSKYNYVAKISWPSTWRKSEVKIDQEIQRLPPEASHHISPIICAKDVMTISDPPQFCFKKQEDQRTLHVLVEKKLLHLEKLKSWEDLRDVVVDVLSCG